MTVVLDLQASQCLDERQGLANGFFARLGFFPIRLDLRNTFWFCELAQRFILTPEELFPKLNSLFFICLSELELAGVGLQKPYPLNLLLIKTKVTSRS
jgi:hypothetical protein